MQFFRQEMKVGAMLLIAITLLVGMIFLVGNFTFKKPEFYHVCFRTVSGLDVSAPVMFAGFNVGKVAAIRVLGPSESKKKKNTNIEVTLSLETPNLIRKDSAVNIRTLGFMGEKYIDISPGTETSPILPSGTNIIGEEPQDFNLIVERLGKELDDLSPKIHKIFDEVESASEKINSIVSDIQKEQVIPDIFSDARIILQDVKEVGEKLKELVSTGKDKVDVTLENIQVSSEEIRSALSTIIEKIQQALDKIQQVIDTSKQVVTNVDGVIVDNRDEVHAMILNLESVSTNMKGFSQTIKEHPWRLIFKTREEKLEARQKEKAARKNESASTFSEKKSTGKEQEKSKILKGNQF